MNFHRVLESGAPLSFEENILFPQQELWLDTRLTPILDENDAPVAVLGIARDITNREHKATLITRAKQEWERAVDTMTMLLAIVNSQYRITRVNAAMAERLDVSVRDAVGMVCYEKLHGTTKPPPFCPLMQLMADGEEHSTEVCENHLRGNTMVTVSSLCDRQGRPIGCVYVGREGIEREKAAAARKKSEEQMKLLMTHAEHIVAIQSREGRYLFFYASPEYGLCQEDIVGKTPFDFFEPARASKMVEQVVRVATTGLTLTQLGEITWNGETLHFFEQIAPLKDSSDEIRSVVRISRKVVDHRRGGGEEARKPADAGHGLSQRETEILRMIASGLTNKQIAEQLFISKKTVATHRARIMNKLDVHKTSALVKFAVKTGLL
jgi:DNA-binding CsgD family transcriptional regulator